MSLDSDRNFEQPDPWEEEEEYFSQPVELPLEDVLDLHTFSPKEVPGLVEDYIQHAYEVGFKQVRIIHGKGKGVLRAIVHSVLAKSPYVRRIEPTPAEFGGWGATVVILRRRE